MPNALRTAAPMGDWRSVHFYPITAVVGIRDGEATGVSYLYLVNRTVGAVLESAAAGEKAVLIYHAEKIMVPKSAVGMGTGQRVYFDQATRLVTNVWAANHLWIGIVTETAAAADDYVEIDLAGNMAILAADVTA